MLDQKAIQRSVRAQVFGHWSVLGPLLGAGGFTSYGLFIADDWKMPIFGSILFVCGGVASLAYRLLVKRDKIVDEEVARAKAAFEAERNAIADKREQNLDAFRRKLASDNDTRDEHLLDDLREVADAFRSDRTWVENVPAQLATGILALVDKSFEACIAKLDRSFTLREKARAIRGDGKKDLLDTSSKLLDEVEKAVEELGSYFAKVNKLSIKRLAGATLDQSDMSSSMQELHAMLAAAETAEQTRQQLLTGNEDRYKEYETS